MYENLNYNKNLITNSLQVKIRIKTKKISL